MMAYSGLPCLDYQGALGLRVFYLYLLDQAHDAYILHPWPSGYSLQALNPNGLWNRDSGDRCEILDPHSILLVGFEEA